MSSVWLIALDYVFLFVLAYYLMNNLQWYNYSLYRVLTKHHKRSWHLFYFVFPLIAYGFSAYMGWVTYFYFALIGLYLPIFVYWILRLDKPLKWTGRVWRFFGILALFASVDAGLELVYGEVFGSFVMALGFALLCSDLSEMMLFNRYKKLAREKIASMTQLKIILITASYGKTSIKNYLYQILKARFRVQATPRSVNTLKGIVADINTNLDLQSDFYIVEAGARQRGDIAEIAEFLNPQFVIIGKIGPQHLEYFKSLDQIVETKFEALRSSRLKCALIERSNPMPENLPRYADRAKGEIDRISSTLQGTKFDMLLEGEWYQFETKVLGSFNAHNIALCIEMAQKIGLNLNEIANRVRRLESVEHRLSKSEVGGKVILDDSFNGNLEGMKEAIKISSEHQGRKVIVTPGIIESTDEMNVCLAQEIDKVFDVVIITGELNAKILSQEIKHAKKILLKDKDAMENTLKASLKEGDLVLFANDAPSYI